MKVYTTDGIFYFNFRYEKESHNRILTLFTAGQVFMDQSQGGTEITDRYQVLISGAALCSKDDKYDKRFGRFLAFRRALSHTQDRAFRKVIGDAVRERVNLVPLNHKAPAETKSQKVRIV